LVHTLTSAQCILYGVYLYMNSLHLYIEEQALLVRPIPHI
jgi:hypothetical protein